ncbi:MAG: fibronectin type III domain-containing protein [Lachnospiraceae bacterium]|nr:fibronectin type III domain-containing protein [Lachnospiraceae bacterium]
MKAKKVTQILATLVFALVMAVSVSTTSKAAYAITQAAQTPDSITVALDKTAIVSGSGYALANWTITLQKQGENYSWVDVQPAVALDPNATTYTFVGLAPGAKYQARIDYTLTYTYRGKTETKAPRNSTQYIYTAPGKVTGVNQSKWWYYIESVDFAWDNQDACKYEWVAFQGKKQVANGADVYGNSGSFKIKNNKLYTVQVRAYEDINGVRVYGDWSDTAYLFTQPMIERKTGNISVDGSGKMHIKWGKISGVSGYEVYVSTKEKSGYKRVAKVKAKKGSVTVKKLGKKKFKKNKTYFVYVVAKKKVGGITYTSGRHYSTMYKKGSNTVRWSFDGTGK